MLYQSVRSSKLNMPISYNRDTGRKVIFLTLEGVITDAEISEHLAKMRSDPAFNASFSRFVDCSRITEWKVSVSAIQRAAQRVRNDAGRKTAIFAPQDMSFGTARMLEAMTADSQGKTMVFRDIDETKKWLGID